MNKTYIINGGIILKDKLLKNASIEIDGSKIAAVGRNLRPKKGSLTIDAKGAFVSPGFIDCHIHGDPHKIFSHEVKYGTTAFVISQSCAPLEVIYKRTEKIKEFINRDPLGKNVLGLRLEGPYINKERAGAQNRLYIKNPDLHELISIINGCRGLLKIMTIAPELSGVKPLLKTLRKEGIISSIGHSDATYEDTVDGIDAGIRHATHTFNAMSPLDRRSPGVIGAILLDDRITTEIILDLVHVHNALFSLLMKIKKKDNVIIITDSIKSEIASPAYGGVAMTGGAYRFEDGRLAGSALNMIEALKNAVTKCNLGLPEALRLITYNPAKLLGVEDKKGTLEPGKDADVVVFDKEFDVKMTMVRGKIAYRKGK